MSHDPEVLDEEALLWIEHLRQGEGYFDWNNAAVEAGVCVVEPTEDQLRIVKIRDESLRDGLGPCPKEPNTQERVGLVEALLSTGIEFVTVDIFSSADDQHLSSSNQRTLELVKWMGQRAPSVAPVILARANKHDLSYLKRSYDINPQTTAIIFQDLSEVRRRVENWGDFSVVLDNLVANVKDAKAYGLQVIGFTENLSITSPDHVVQYVRAMCEAGVDYIGIADTAGRLVPAGAAFLTRAVRQAIEQYRAETGDGRSIGIVFHGHDDLGMAVTNTFAAISEGASMVDVVVNGIGERVGNTDLIQVLGGVEHRLRMLVRGKGREYSPRFDLTRLGFLSEMYERITGVRPGEYHKLVGERAFATNFGIHANYYLWVEVWAATLMDHGYSGDYIRQFKGEAWRLYSALSPADVDRQPDIRISALSGAANVILWAFYHELIADVRALDKNSSVVKTILGVAKLGWGELSEEQIQRLWAESFD